MIRILLVEDEASLSEIIQLNLELTGYDVVVCADGQTAIETFMAQRFELVILDVMMPHMDGFQVCESIKQANASIPVMFLTAKGNADDRILGLELGAEDYLVKPFNLQEFLLRVKILVRRNAQSDKDDFDEPIMIGSSSLNLRSFEIQVSNGATHQLSQKEASLLKLLIRNQGKVVERNKILEQVWGYDVYPSTRTIDNYILAFRKYFELDPKNPVHFISVRGVGYKFTK